MNDMPLIIQILEDFGFPTLISLYLLIRFEKKIEKLEDVIQSLSSAIKKSLNKEDP